MSDPVYEDRTAVREAFIQIASEEKPHYAAWATEVLDAALAASPTIPVSEPRRAEPRLTHGRHCRCSACARQDWAEPYLAPCGMHGPSCPPIYDPYPTAKLGEVGR